LISFDVDEHAGARGNEKKKRKKKMKDERISNKTKKKTRVCLSRCDSIVILTDIQHRNKTKTHTHI